MSMTTDYPDNISNLRRLRGLSPKRRVYSGIDQSLDDLPEDDLSQTGMDLPPMPSAPLPDPNNFDIRANQILPLGQDDQGEGEDQENQFYRLGKGLGEIARMRQGSEPSDMPRAPDWSKLVQQQRALDPNWNPPAEIASRVEGEVAPELPPADTFQGGGIPDASISDPSQPPSPDEMAAQSPLDQAIPEVPEDQNREPLTYVEVGAVDSAASNPEVKSELERIFGTITPEMAQQANDFEMAINAELQGISDAEARLTDTQREIRTRLENRDLSTGQKVAMAIALLAPVLVGAVVGGKEGFLGALGGGGEALANALGNREKGFRADEEMLGNLAQAQSKIGTQKLETSAKAREMRQKLLDSVGNKKLRDLLQNNLGTIQDENGKDQLVIDTGDPLIPLKTSAVRDEEDYKHFKKSVLPKLRLQVTDTQRAIEIADQLQDMVRTAQDKEVLPFGIGRPIKGAIPQLRENIVDPDTGKEVRISELFDTKREQLLELYQRTVGTTGASKAPAASREHFLKTFPNPFNLGSTFKGTTDLDTVSSQLNTTKKTFEDSLLGYLKSNGVETAPIKSIFSSNPDNAAQNNTKRQKQRAEEEAAKYL